MAARKLKARVLIHDKDLYPEGLTKGSEDSVAFDLRCNEDFMIHEGQRLKVDTMVSITPPKGYSSYLELRSSMRNKGLTSNGLGIIDPDYTGHIMLILQNNTTSSYKFKRGDRVAQLFFLPVPKVTVEEVEGLEETVRGDGGFGSSGRG